MFLIPQGGHYAFLGCDAHLEELIGLISMGRAAAVLLLRVL